MDSEVILVVIGTIGSLIFYVVFIRLPIGLIRAYLSNKKSKDNSVDDEYNSKKTRKK